MFTVIVILLVVASLILIRKWQTPKNSPPGPLCLPLIGYPGMFVSDQFHLHSLLTKLAEQYGPIYKIALGSKPLVVLTDPDLIREAFGGVDPPVLLRFVSDTMLMSAHAQSLINATDRDFWGLMRRVCSPMTKNLGVPIIQILTEEKVKMFSEIEKYVGKEVHLSPFFFYYTRNVFLRILLGESWTFPFSEEQARFAKCQVAVQGRNRVLEYFPILEKIRNTFYTLPQYSYMRDFELKLLSERRKRNNGSFDNPKDLLDVFLYEQTQHPEITDGVLIGTLQSVFNASTATAADAIDWMLLFLCVKPEIQEKVYQELKDVLKGKTPTMDDQPNLPYLERVTKETLRLRPTAPLGLIRLAERDCVIGGYNINKGDMVIKNMYGVGNMERFYKNHKEFDPDRWLGNLDPANLIPFGVGPTQCLGKPVAVKEIFLASASLLQRYKFAISPNSPTPDFVGEFKTAFNPKVWLTTITLRE